MSTRNIIGYALAVLVITAQAQAPATSKQPAGTKSPAAVTAQKQSPAAATPAAATVPKPAPTVSTSPQQPGGMIVKRAAIALDIVDREPKDTGTVFPPEVRRLYCFTEIGNGEGQEIQHRWYWNDDLLNTVSLKITSNRYRTYSAKTIAPGMVGEWRVAVVDSRNEAVLQMVNFTVK